jgi:Heliorhodopsin
LSSETPAICGPVAARIRRDNAIASLVHLLQAAAVLVLASGFALPETAAYLQRPPGTPAADPEVLFDVPTGAAVAGLLALSALAHLLVCTAWRSRYLADLGRHRNQARWVEYAVSSSLMIVLIAQLVGIADVAALLALFGVNASMILFGWLQRALRGARSRRLVAVLLWVPGRGRAVARHRGLPAVPGLDILSRPARLRVRHHRVAVRLSSTSSHSTSGCSTAPSAAGPTISSANASTSCSASPRVRTGVADLRRNPR